jgi:hypothetical protein
MPADVDSEATFAQRFVNFILNPLELATFLFELNVETVLVISEVVSVGHPNLGGGFAFVIAKPETMPQLAGIVLDIDF